MIQQNETPYIDRRLEVRWIPEISGRGIFAKNAISAGSIIERAPLIIYPKKLMNMGIYMLRAEGMNDDEFILDQYALRWNEDAAIPLGWAAIYNHSDHNNCRFANDGKSTLLHIITLRGIEAGEQCCVSYGPDWFTQKSYIKKIDF